MKRGSLWFAGVVVAMNVSSACGQGGPGAPVGPGTGSSGGAPSATANGSDGAAPTGADGASGTPDPGSGGGSGSGGGTGGGSDGGSGAGSSGSGSSSGGGTGSGSGVTSDAGTDAAPVPPGAAALFPPAGGQGICADPPLRITFAGPPRFGTAGKIQVFAVSQPGTPVATVDMAAATQSDTIGGTTFNKLRPAYVDGNDAVIYLKSHALAYGQTYYVTVDTGAILGPTGTPLVISGTSTWRFSTAASAPVPMSSATVALDGSGEFCSVQGAIDAVSAQNATAITIAIKAGTYHEIVHFSSKKNITLLGENRKTTIVAGTNNNTLNPSTATRSLVGIDASSGIVIDNLTIHNLTPQGGSQAEALRMQSCDQCVVRNADIISLQDTILWSGRVYAKNCYIEGNVDFVWGTGTAYFTGCEIKTTVRSGYNVQARNPSSAYGYVFVDSKLTADPGLTGHLLARIDASVYPASHVAYINCQMGSHIAPAGWLITGSTNTSQLRFWEYQSVDPAGTPIDVSQRVAGSTQLSAAQAAAMRDPTVVLSGWLPPP